MVKSKIDLKLSPDEFGAENGLGTTSFLSLPTDLVPSNALAVWRVYPAFPVMLARMACQIRRGQRLHGRKSVYNALYPLSRKRENLWLAK